MNHYFAVFQVCLRSLHLAHTKYVHTFGLLVNRMQTNNRPSQYPSCYPDWVDFIPRSCKHTPTVVRHFMIDLKLVAPAPAPAAILAYLTLVNKLSSSWTVDNTSKVRLAPIGVVHKAQKSLEREGEWARLCSLANPKVLLRPRLSGAFTPGSFEGVWEGIFTVRLLTNLVFTR
jgi:hypothetical protein